jgi:hypothetical protein
VTYQEQIEGLYFPAFRGLAKMIVVPAEPPYQTSMEISISSVELSNAQRVDASAPLE